MTNDTKETKAIMEMTIAEGMKTLRLIEKRVADNAACVQKYAAQPSHEKPIIDGDEQMQRNEIKKLVQSSRDLLMRYRRIHASIAITNLTTFVEFKSLGVVSIHELLQIKRKTGALLGQVLRAMNDEAARGMTRGRLEPTDITYFYDEREMRNQLRELEDTLNSVDSRLETVNATTTLTAAPVNDPA